MRKRKCDKNTAVNSSGDPGGGDCKVDGAMDDERESKWFVNHVMNPAQTWAI